MRISNSLLTKPPNYNQTLCQRNMGVQIQIRWQPPIWIHAKYQFKIQMHKAVLATKINRFVLQTSVEMIMDENGNGNVQIMMTSDIYNKLFSDL